MGKIFTVVRQNWVESESGWGQSPDGCSLHLTTEDCDKFCKDFWKEEHKRNPSGVTPDYYVREEGSPFPFSVDLATYRRLKKFAKNHGIHAEYELKPYTGIDPKPKTSKKKRKTTTT